MINNTIEVSPRNRVDFSRLRRFQPGGRIPKYQQGPGRSGITYNEGTSWRTHMFDLFSTKLYEAFKNEPDEAKRREYMNLINETQHMYAAIRKKYPNLTPVLFDQAVKDYQLRIIDKFEWVNTKGVTYGLSTEGNRYNFLQSDPTKRNTGDRPTDGDWSRSADGMFSGQTQDRTILGYGDDWDINSDEFKTHQDKLHELNMETFKDEDGSWQLRDWTDPNATDPNATDPNATDPNATDPKETGPATTLRGNYDPDQYNQKSTFDPGIWDGALKNAPILAASLMANKRDYDLAMNQKTVLKEPVQQDYIATDDYFSQLAANNTAANMRARAQKIANSSSNLEQNQLMQFLGEAQASEAELQGQNLKAKQYRLDQQEANKTANWNLQQSVITANENRQNLVALDNTKIAARQKYLATRNALLEDNLIKNNTDYGQWKENAEKNRDRWMYDQDVLAAKKDLALAYEPYSDLQESITNSESFQGMLGSMYNYIDANPLDPDALKLVDFYNEISELPEEERNQRLQEYIIANPDNAFVKQVLAGYEKEVNDALKAGEAGYKLIQFQLEAIKASYPRTYNTNGWYNRFKAPDRVRYQSQFSLYKDGGKIPSLKNGERMVKYLEHKRKAEVDRRKAQIEVIKNNQKSIEHGLKVAQNSVKELNTALKRELDSLDKETLLLLRSIFK